MIIQENLTLHLDETEAIRELNLLFLKLKNVQSLFESQRISFYKPIGQQGAASRALNNGAATVLVLGSNRSGKTVWGVIEALAHSIGYRPWLDPDDPDRIVRLTNGEPIPVPNTGCIIADNFKHAVQRTIGGKMREWFPSDWYKIKRDNRGIPERVIWANGSEIYLMANQQDDETFEGPDGHWVWADEPIDYRKYTGLKRGLVDHSGHMWMTMTPLNQPWIHDMIVSRANEADGSVKLFKFSIWDNCRDNGGYLRREDIEEFLKDLREDELEARLHGNFLHLAGRVFKTWQPQEPYYVPAKNIPVTWPRVCVIDPHPRKPIAVLWAAINPYDQIIVYRDLYDPSLRTVRDVATRIKYLEGWTYDEEKDSWTRGPKAEPVVLRIMDDSAKQDERTSGDTIWKRFIAEQIWAAMARKRNAAAGYDAIQNALQTEKYEWGGLGLIVHNTCRHVKYDFMNFVWDDWTTSKQRDLKGDKQEVRKNNDDFIDCIRYIYQMGVTYNMLKHEQRRADGVDKEPVRNGRDLFTGLHAGMTRKERNNQWPTFSKSSRSRESGSRGTALSSTINPTLRPNAHLRKKLEHG